MSELVSLESSETRLLNELEKVDAEQFEGNNIVVSELKVVDHLDNTVLIRILAQDLL